jgi:hypothetical protein
MKGLCMVGGTALGESYVMLNDESNVKLWTRLKKIMEWLGQNKRLT